MLEATFRKTRARREAAKRGIFRSACKGFRHFRLRFPTAIRKFEVPASSFIVMPPRGTPAPFTRRILAVLKAIPRGKVAAYGQVAALAGNPRGARQVARALHSLSAKERLPWHRVIGASGRISLPAGAGGEEQARRLRREGVAVGEGGEVDMARFGWRPAGRFPGGRNHPGFPAGTP